MREKNETAGSQVFIPTPRQVKIQALAKVTAARQRRGLGISEHQAAALVIVLEVFGDELLRQFNVSDSERPRADTSDVSFPATQAETLQVSQPQLLAHASLVQEMETTARQWIEDAEAWRLNKGQRTREKRGHEVLASCGHDVLALLRRSAHAETREKLKEAATVLYMVGRWSAPGISDEMAAKLWEDLRDALGLPPGTATSVGIGA